VPAVAEVFKRQPAHSTDHRRCARNARRAPWAGNPAGPAQLPEVLHARGVIGNQGARNSCMCGDSPRLRSEARSRYLPSLLHSSRDAGARPRWGLWREPRADAIRWGRAGRTSSRLAQAPSRSRQKGEDLVRVLSVSLVAVRAKPVRLGAAEAALSSGFSWHRLTCARGDSTAVND